MKVSEIKGASTPNRAILGKIVFLHRGLYYTHFKKMTSLMTKLVPIACVSMQSLYFDSTLNRNGLTHC